MFSPATKRKASRTSSSPAAAAGDDRVAGRPSFGTPAPWAAPRLSLLARIPSGSDADRGGEVEQTKPVFVGDFPPAVRGEQLNTWQKHAHGDACPSGGIDRETLLSWIISGNRIFVWSYLSPAASKKCISLTIPSALVDSEANNADFSGGTEWLLDIINWESGNPQKRNVGQEHSSIGIVICNKRSRTVLYWPDIYSKPESDPIISVASADEAGAVSLPSPFDGKASPNKQRQRGRLGSGSPMLSTVNSLIATSISNEQKECIALACSSTYELWQFHCSPHSIIRKLSTEDALSTFQSSDIGHDVSRRATMRSLAWRSPSFGPSEASRQFFLLTDHEIHCFCLKISPNVEVIKLWTHEIIGNDGGLGIKKDIAGQKRIWPLDLKVDDSGKVISVLVATFCKDRVSGSSYTEYSLLTMQYKSGVSVSSEAAELSHERILEKKAPIQVIIPKARVEDEEFLFSMRLRVGGRPSGSAVILSGDGTATVSHYYRNSTRLFLFDLPYDAGKVLDASVLPSTDDNEEGAWIVLTEKAGIWAIPEKAIVLGGVEPPERSLSRKGSTNGGSAEEERRNVAFVGNVAPRRASSEAMNTGDRQRAIMTGIARRTAQDEESEALLGQFFQEFLQSERVNDSLERLKAAGAFERDGETNVFARISKSIVDTLAKHWTTTRGVEIASMAIISNQLIEKKHKHEKFLLFLALSKCHDELCLQQRNSLQIILEHGEKLAGIIQLRELQNSISQHHSGKVSSPQVSSEGESLSALWDLIQLVGDRTRRNIVLLMDRENAEVFYSRISDVEEFFNCLAREFDYLIGRGNPMHLQIRRALELSSACENIVQSAMDYKNEHHLWYPPPEGLTPWYCQSVVRNGLWSIASFMLEILNEAARLDKFLKSEVYSHLEAMAAILLEAYSVAITAKVERGEEQKGLLEDYWTRRDSLLECLYKQIKILSGEENQDAGEATNQEKVEKFRALSVNLLSLGKQHESYKTLWCICCDLNDSMLLKNLMRDSVGPRGGFCYFVFKQLYKRKEYSKLLRLGEDFPEDLSIFLQRHSNLLWLHELFLDRFSSASDTLHAVALSQEESTASTSDEDVNMDRNNSNLTIAERKRFLSLSKIAALAGNDPDADLRTRRIDADLRILKLQEEITHLLEDEEKQNLGRRLLSPEDLITLCLKSDNPSLLLCSFEVFAWTSSSFRRYHKNLLEECWRKAADLDNWDEIYRSFAEEGRSDNETLQILKGTLLYQASSRCYSHEAETFEDGFEEALPLRKETPDAPSLLRESGSSVEAVLMQHRSFPEANKLMLAAIVLGSTQGRAESNDVYSPME
ncbi:hypothetical protein MLD38_009079 [Melastoma candidum]|uniref:Uncharacterized protein n=1 Tax=Melastoma candidum TaxID=119954 RepID=A0ACB9RXT2_9MYRT|nr:hypothetical protein MLD38_009079 [Melastoma candidum]